MTQENKEQVIKLLTWIQGYQPQPSPTYMTIFNFDKPNNTYSLKLYNTRMDVSRDNDGFLGDGLWRMVTQNPSRITAHRLYDLLPHIQEYDEDYSWTLKSLKRIVYYEQFTYARNQYMKFRTDFPDIEDLCEEGRKIDEEEDRMLHEIAMKKYAALLSPEEKPKESAKEKASKLWKLDVDKDE